MQVGINAAVIFRNLVFWVRHNEANRRNFHDGRYWTYNSLAAFDEQFPYTRQDRSGPAALIDKSAGQIMVGGRILRLTCKPSLQLACAVAGKHPEAVGLAQVDQMPSPRYVDLGVMGKLIHLFADIRSVISTARKHGLNILETLTLSPAQIIARL